jgi:CheY-like chemotaxis protein
MAYILIIDDSEFALDFIREMLVEAGHGVAATGDPAEFMRLVEQSPRPNALIVDAVMPDISGPELIEKLRAHPDPAIADLPVILASALEGQFAAPEGVLLLPKPFGPEELAQALRFALA